MDLKYDEEVEFWDASDENDEDKQSRHMNALHTMHSYAWWQEPASMIMYNNEVRRRMGLQIRFLHTLSNPGSQKNTFFLNSVVYGKKMEKRRLPYAEMFQIWLEFHKEMDMGLSTAEKHRNIEISNILHNLHSMYPGKNFFCTTIHTAPRTHSVEEIWRAKFSRIFKINE